MSDDFAEKMARASEAFREAIQADEDVQEEFWRELTPDQQLDAFCCVVRRIYQGDVVDQTSYRGVLYDVFGFGPEAYVPAQCAGYLEVHNLIYDGLRYQEQNRASEIAAEIEALDEVIKPE